MERGNNFIGRAAALLLICALLCAVLSGCGGAPEAPAEPQGENAVTVTDLAGVTHSFPGPVKKAAVQWSCAGGPFMTMSALLGDETAEYLACIDDSPEKYRADVWEQCVKDMPALADVPVVGSADQELNLEAVLASGAEVFICPLELKKVMDESLASQLESVGIPVVYVDYHQETVENHTASTLLLGKLFGREERAQEIVDFYTEHRAAVEERLQEILKSEPRPELYIEVGMMGPSDYGNSFDNNYSWGGIAYRSGGSSIGEGAVMNLGPLDGEYVLSRDPDKIVFTGAYGSSVPDAVRLGYGAEKEETLKNIEAFFRRPGWSELSAYRSGEVYAINHGMAREMYDCACFEFFAKICFPEQFEDLDPAGTLNEYFDRFMPYTLSGLWFIY